jgi:hypothetical protein
MSGAQSPLDAIQSSLPNGFHDALLHELRIGVEKSELQLILAPDMSLESGERWDPGYRKALLTLTGIDVIEVDPITLDSREVPDRQVFLDIAKVSDRDVMQRFNRELKSGQWACSIFLSELNASVRVVAAGATFVWLE